MCNLRKYEKEINEQKRKHKKGGKKEEEEKETRENVRQGQTQLLSQVWNNLSNKLKKERLDYNKHNNTMQQQQTKIKSSKYL